jgi:N-acetyl-anhydromuramyl-L-alanine amidase AmpD
MQQFRRAVLSSIGGIVSGTGLLGTSPSVGGSRPPVRQIPAAPSNYRSASRTASDIDWIIVHTVEGSYQAGINTFRNPSSNVSAHYVVGTESGQLTQMVDDSDVAWTAGNSDYNDRSLNIELAGYSSTDFPEQQYATLAELIDFLTVAYEIPAAHPTDQVTACTAAAGQGGLIGHAQVPNPYDCSVGGGIGGHTDPGPYFDYERALTGTGGGDGGGSDSEFEVGDAVTATTALNTRSGPGLGDPVLETVSTGTGGTIDAGTVTANGYLWWEVAWETGPTGWSVETYLDAADDSDEAFEIGEQVASTTALNTRDGPGLGKPVLDTVSTGTTGYVKNGIVTADGYTWWKVAWETGPTGWSVEQHLEAT